MKKKDAYLYGNPPSVNKPTISNIVVTHWKFRCFRGIGYIGKLGQYDLLWILINLLGHTMSLVSSTESGFGTFISEPQKNQILP